MVTHSCCNGEQQRSLHSSDMSHTQPDPTTDFGMRLHHVGMVVRSIPTAAKRLTSGLGLTWDGRIVEDPVQTVRVSFLDHVGPQGTQLELVEPLSEHSKVAAFLSKGGGCHHICYEVEDLAGSLARIRQAGAVIVQQPVPAVAFEGRHIAWVYTADRLLIEFLASDATSPLVQEVPQG